jgi:hypothetical protein
LLWIVRCGRISNVKARRIGRLLRDKRDRETQAAAGQTNHPAPQEELPLIASDGASANASKVSGLSSESWEFGPQPTNANVFVVNGNVLAGTSHRPPMEYLQTRSDTEKDSLGIDVYSDVPGFVGSGPQAMDVSLQSQ